MGGRVRGGGGGIHGPATVSVVQVTTEAVRMSVYCTAAWAMFESMVLLQLWATLLSMVTYVATEGHVDVHGL